MKDHRISALLCTLAMAMGLPSLAQPTAPARQQGSATAAPRPAQSLRPCEGVTVDPPTYLTLGKSRVIRLPVPAVRMLVGGQGSTRAGRALPAAGPGAAAPGAVG